MAAYGLAQGDGAQGNGAQANGPQGYWVALSGGLDSMVLAHLAKTYLPNVRLLHINHGLSPFADQWQQQVERWAAGQNLPCHSRRVEVVRQGESLEAAARKARYAAFEAVLGPGDALLCGHHLNDQAETFFLRLLRGSGLAGLTGMAPVRPLAAGVLLRPLLGLERGQLLAYANTHGLTWVEDESNSDERFERNWLRHSLFPLINSRWPQAATQVANTSERLREEHQLLQEYLACDLAACNPRPERLGHSLDLTCLLQGSASRRNSLLRLWFSQLHLLPPSQAVLAQMELLINSRLDSEACVNWGQWQLRRFAGRLYVMPQLNPIDVHWQVRWHSKTPLLLPNGSSFSAQPHEVGLAPGEYTLRLRQGGERSHPEQRAHSQTLKKLLQEMGVEPWLRNQLPLVYQGEQLVAVGDLWIERGFSVQQGVKLNWQFPAHLNGMENS